MAKTIVQYTIWVYKDEDGEDFISRNSNQFVETDWKDEYEADE